MRFVAQRRLRLGGAPIEPGTVITAGQLHDRNWRGMVRRGEIAYEGDRPEGAPSARPAKVEGGAGQQSPPATTGSPAPPSIDAMNAAELVAAIEDGSVDPDEARAYERSRGRPRVTVLRALGEDV